MSKVTVRTIAELARVSIGTVDRVLNNRGEVSEKTREKVLRIAKDTNYAPDFLASHLATKRSKVLAFLLPAVMEDTPFWKSPHDGIMAAVNDFRHYNIEVKALYFNQFDEESFRRGAAELISLSPDGAIVVPFFPKACAELTTELYRRHIPYVYINALADDTNYLSYIGQDSFRSGYLAARLMSYGLGSGRDILIANIYRAISGHRHIQSRVDGFCKYFADNPELRATIHVVDIQQPELTDIIRQLDDAYRKANHLAGIFVTNSRVYMAAKFLVRQNIKGVRLIGYDLIPENLPYLEDGLIDFLISQKPYEQGYEAVSTLMNFLVLKRQPKQIQTLPIDILTHENIKDYQLNG